MNDDSKLEVKRRVSVPALLDALSLEHSGEGRNMLCPFHAESDPSCTVYEDHVHCHSGCGSKDIFDLWQVVRGGTFKEALGELAAKAGVSLARPALASDMLDAFCSERKLRRDLLETVWGGEAGRWRSPGGGRMRPALILKTAIGARRIRFLDRPQTDNEPKVSFEKGGRAHWYGLDQAKEVLGRDVAGQVLYVVNGEPSVWACYQSGVAAVCTAAGEGKVPKDADGLAGLGVPVRVVYDLDEAGRVGAAKVAKALRTRGKVSDVAVLLLPDTVGDKGDVDDLHQAVGDGGLCDALGGLPVDERGGNPTPAAPPANDEGQRPEIVIQGPDTHARTMLVLDRLRADNNGTPTVFDSDGSLAHISGGASGAQIRRLGFRDNTIWGFLSGRYRFAQKTEDGKKRSDSAPSEVCKFIAAAGPGTLDLPPLESVIRAPGFSADGSVLRDGYCEASRAWVDLGGLDVPNVQDRPSRDEQRQALSLLEDDLLVDFIFDSDASRAHALALILTPFIRAMLPYVEGVAPLFLVSAPAPGTGKGLFSRLPIIIAEGRPEPSALRLHPSRRDDAENAKAILAAMMRSPSILRLDNLPMGHTVDSPALAEALTSDSYEGRELGSSRVASAVNRVTWMATANNPRLSDELTRRSVYIRILGESERPDERTGFKHELPGWAVDNRPALVGACLTIVRAWIADGMPKGSAILGSFQPWASAISGILDVAGVNGFLSNREDLRSAVDDDQPLWRVIVKEWWTRYRSGNVTVSMLRKYVLTDVDEAHMVLGEISDPISQGKRLADAIRNRIGRVYDRWRVVEAGRDSKTKARTYKLIDVHLAEVPAEVPISDDVTSANQHCGINDEAEVAEVGGDPIPPRARKTGRTSSDGTEHHRAYGSPPTSATYANPYTGRPSSGGGDGGGGGGGDGSSAASETQTEPYEDF